MAWVAPTIAASSPIARWRKPPILALAYISPARSSKRRISIILARISRAIFLSGRSCDACFTPVSSGPRTLVASLVATAPEGTRCPRRLSGGGATYAGQVDHEHERRVGRDGGWLALGAVGELGRDDQLAPAADPHSLHALVPAGDHLAAAELELERLRTAAPGRVELLAVLVEHAHVLHAQGVAVLGRRPLALHDVLDLELLRGRPARHRDLGLVGQLAGGLERPRLGLGLGRAAGAGVLGAAGAAATGGDQRHKSGGYEEQGAHAAAHPRA